MINRKPVFYHSGKHAYGVVFFSNLYQVREGEIIIYLTPSRLPQAVVDHDIAQVKGLGVKFVFNTEAKAEDLEDFDAVFVGEALYTTVCVIRIACLSLLPHLKQYLIAAFLSEIFYQGGSTIAYILVSLSPSQAITV